MVFPQEKNPLTYKEYLNLGENIQYEVIDGQIYNMSPSPSVKHQSIAMELSTEFNIYLRNKSCKVLAEIDVCLSGDEDTSAIKEWVRPDLVVVCDQNKVQKSHIAGPPDLIIEILSKSSAKADKMIKFNRYQRAGVKEYWIVDPAHETIDVFVLMDHHFISKGTFTNNEIVKVHLFDDFIIDLKDIFRAEF